MLAPHLLQRVLVLEAFAGLRSSRGSCMASTAGVTTSVASLMPLHASEHNTL
jgi:hypothetical protein